MCINSLPYHFLHAVVSRRVKQTLHLSSSFVSSRTPTMPSPPKPAIDVYHDLIKAQTAQIASLKECIDLGKVGYNRHIQIMENQVAIRDNRCAELEVQLEAATTKVEEKESEISQLLQVIEDLQDEMASLREERIKVCCL